jgi:hypothetical protein
LATIPRKTPVKHTARALVTPDPMNQASTISTGIVYTKTNILKVQRIDKTN